MDVKNLVKKYVCVLFSSVCAFDHDCVSLYDDCMKILLSIPIHMYIYIYIYAQFCETDADNNQICVLGRYMFDCTIRPLINGIYACCVCMFCTGCFLTLPCMPALLEYKFQVLFACQHC